jgi:hypothetical protein
MVRRSITPCLMRWKFWGGNFVRKKTWHRVTAPTPWRPKPGDQLVGEYVGSKVRTGQYGEYLVHLVKVHGEHKYVSGAVVDGLFALVSVGMQVKLVFVGTKLTADTEREYKDFELYTEQAVELKLAEPA